MSEHDNNREMELLERATDALRQSPVPGGPPPHVAASTVQALESSTTWPEQIRLRQRRKLMFRIARYGGAIAAVILVGVLIGFLFLPHENGATAFGDVIEKVKNAKSVRFSMQSSIGHGPALEARMYFQGNGVRGEYLNPFSDKPFLVVIADLDKKKELDLDSVRKIARVIDVDERAARQFVNPVDHLRNLNVEDAEKIGESELHGHKVDVYRLKKVDFLGIQANIEGDEKADATLGVDRETGLPTRFEIRASFEAEGKSNDWIICDDFVWNEKLDPKLFSLEIPKGYTVKKGPLGPKPEAKED